MRWIEKWKELSEEWDKNEGVCKSIDSNYDCFSHYWVEVEVKKGEMSHDGNRVVGRSRKEHNYKYFHAQFSKWCLEQKSEDCPKELKEFVLIGSGSDSDIFIEELKGWKGAEFIRFQAFQFAFWRLSRMVAMADPEYKGIDPNHIEVV